MGERHVEDDDDDDDGLTTRYRNLFSYFSVYLFAKSDRLTWVFNPSQATSSIAFKLLTV